MPFRKPIYIVNPGWLLTWADKHVLDTCLPYEVPGGKKTSQAACTRRDWNIHTRSQVLRAVAQGRWSAWSRRFWRNLTYKRFVHAVTQGTTWRTLQSPRGMLLSLRDRQLTIHLSLTDASRGVSVPFGYEPTARRCLSPAVHAPQPAAGVQGIGQ